MPRRHRPPTSAAKRRTPIGEGRAHSARDLALAALLIAMTAAAYVPALHGDFVFDDHMLLVDNPLVKMADGLYRFWFTTSAVDYWPLFNSALWIQWRLWGMDPTGYHVVNVALHIVDALLLWAVLRTLAIPGAFLGALIFALHPVNVESVAWITQLKNLLAMTFSLLAVLLYARAEQRAARRGLPMPALDARYLASLAAFALAMLSKGSVAIVPLILLGVSAWMRRLTARDGARLAPFVLVSVGLTLVTAWFRARFDTETRPVGLVERVLEASTALWFYLSKALLPIQLSFIYPKWQVHVDDLRWWLPLLAIVAVSGVLWWKRSSWGRPFLWAWLFFGIALAPVLGSAGAGFMEKWSVADHYQHMALIAVAALVAAGWATWRAAAPAGRRGADGAAIVLVSGLALLTWRQSGLYSDAVTLFRASVANNPDSAVARNNLGLALLSAGQPQEAREQFEAALRLKDDYLEAHCNLATALMRANRPAEAIEELHRTLRLRPTYAEAENNLGGILFETGNRGEAIAHYERAVQFRPDYAEAHFNLGSTLYLEGRPREAIDHLRQALRMNPTHAAAHNALAVALTETGEREQGLWHFREAVRLDPGNEEARANLAEVLGGGSAAGHK